MGVVAVLLVFYMCISDAIKGGTTMKSSSVKRKKAGMLKAFWLTLIDPSNEESLKEEGKKRVVDIKNRGKVKGRSLKD